ncbi:MAG: hypothetical protein V4510_09685 [bacterium]
MSEEKKKDWPELRTAIEKAIADSPTIPVDFTEIKRRLSSAIAPFISNDPIGDHVNIRVSCEPRPEDQVRRAPVVTVTMTPKTEWGRRLIKIARGEWP